MIAFAHSMSLGGLRFASLLTAAVMLCASGVSQAQGNLTAMDQGLVHALHQATRDTHDQVTDLDALMWLSDMSERLEHRIPNPFYRVRLLKNLYREAENEGLDPQLVLAVMDIESNFDRYALSRAGAQGLMQVMPFWKDVYGRPNDDLYNPLTSLRYGCRILRHYLDRHENTADALAAYNGSLGRSTYPNKVLRRLNSRWRYKADSYSTQSQTSLAAR